MTNITYCRIVFGCISSFSGCFLLSGDRILGEDFMYFRRCATPTSNDHEDNGDLQVEMIFHPPVRLDFLSFRRGRYQPFEDGGWNLYGLRCDVISSVVLGDASPPNDGFTVKDGLSVFYEYDYCIQNCLIKGFPFIRHPDIIQFHPAPGNISVVKQKSQGDHLTVWLEYGNSIDVSLVSRMRAYQFHGDNLCYISQYEKAYVSSKPSKIQVVTLSNVGCECGGASSGSRSPMNVTWTFEIEIPDEFDQRITTHVYFLPTFANQK